MVEGEKNKMINQHAAGENHGDYRFNLLVEV